MLVLISARMSRSSLIALTSACIKARAIKSNGTDLSFVTVEILDKDGNLCPNAENLVQFSIDGKGFIAGVDNGSPISLERFKNDKRKAFYGKCLVVLQNNGKKGKINLKAVSEGLKDAQLTVKCATSAK